MFSIYFCNPRSFKNSEYVTSGSWLYKKISELKGEERKGEEGEEVEERKQRKQRE